MALELLTPFTKVELEKKEKDKNHILVHGYGVWGNGAEEFICGAEVEK